MRNVFFWLLCFCCFLLSCSSQNHEVSRISDQHYTVITDSIYTRLPGSIFYQTGYLYWWDPFSAENFLHAVNVETGNEEVSFGNVGQGPDDFTLPLFAPSPSGGIYINDINKDLEILYQWNSRQDSLLVHVGNYQNNPNSVRMTCVDDETKVFLCPKDEQLFHVITLLSQISKSYPYGASVLEAVYPLN